jgi:hypothetical protein
LASRFCKIRGEKHPRAFVKVVEGSESYNFPIHHLVPFSCKIRVSIAQTGPVQHSQAGCDVARAPALRPRARHVALASGPPARAPRRAALPEAALSSRQRAFPRWARTPTATGVHAAACRARTRGRSARPCCPRAPRALPVAGPPFSTERSKGAPSHYKGGATRRATHAPTVRGPSRRRRH